MIRQGRVVAVSQGEIKVCFERLETCEKCGMCSGRKQESLVSFTGTADVGDMIEVEMPEAEVLKASALMYIIPLVGMLLGLFCLNAIFPGKDLMLALGAFVGLLISLIVLQLADKNLKKKGKWQPKIISITQSLGNENRRLD